MQFEGDLSMELSFFLSTFTALVDRIVNLEKTKIQDKKILFNEIVHPLFEELEPVVSNYIEIFRKARKIVTGKYNEKYSEGSEVIADERNVMLEARTKVRAMAHKISELIDDEEVVRFACAIGEFFYGTAELTGHTVATVLIIRLESGVTSGTKLSSESEKEIETITLTFIDETIKSFEKSWDKIVQIYESLKIHSVSPKKLVRKSQTKKPKL